MFVTIKTEHNHKMSLKNSVDRGFSTTACTGIIVIHTATHFGIAQTLGNHTNITSVGDGFEENTDRMAQRKVVSVDNEVGIQMNEG